MIDNLRSIYTPEGLDTSLVNRHGITMARFPDWCDKYVSLRNVPNHEIESVISILGTTPDTLKTTHQYAQLLRYLLKRNGTLIRMYETNGERSIDEYMLPHYHAIVIMDNTRMRMYYQFDLRHGHVRGWIVHYTYDSTYDIWAVEDRKK